MSPRELDAVVIQARLALIRELLHDLRSTGGATPERLNEDRMLRHGIERILSQLVELSVSINGHLGATLLGRAPQHYRDSFELAAQADVISPELSVRLQRSVGLRNILTHEYVAIDLAIVAEATSLAVQDYGEYVHQVAAWLAGRQDP